MTNEGRDIKRRQRAKGGPYLVDDIRRLDPNGGVLVSTTCWRPRLGDANPEQPGEKVSIVSYLPTHAEDPCPCGSGNRFGACCQPLPYWQVLCPNPGMQGYSPLRSQSACFTTITADEVYEFLQEDERLYCVEDTPQRAFWIFWGDPAFDLPYGTVCFGDFELQENHTLLVTALSDVRMQVLLELLRPLNLGTPQMQRDSFTHVEKPVRKVSGGKRRRKP